MPKKSKTTKKIVGQKPKGGFAIAPIAIPLAISALAPIAAKIGQKIAGLFGAGILRPGEMRSTYKPKLGAGKKKSK